MHSRFEKSIFSGNRLAIADTANNRIILCDREGRVFHIVGSGETGKQDGNFTACSFNSPQGVIWHRSNTVFVADCDNHLIRKVIEIYGNKSLKYSGPSIPIKVQSIRFVRYNAMANISYNMLKC